MKTKDISGFVFGKLTALHVDRTKSRVAYLCRCECGKEKVILKQSLLSGATKSCGCAARKYNHPNNYNPETYRLWYSMIRRCYDKKTNGYEAYNSKGVIVCDRWLGEDGFVNFIDDMGERPSKKHSIDRVNNDGIYEPKNCRWATHEEQANNRSNNRMITIKDKTLSVAQWSRVYGINPQTVHERLNRGWDDVTAVTKPV